MRGWQALVSAFTRHAAARYGGAEVRPWYFEVWNEPSLPAFFAGSQQEYFDPYNASMDAVKAALERLG